MRRCDNMVLIHNWTDSLVRNVQMAANIFPAKIIRILIWKKFSSIIVQPLSILKKKLSSTGDNAEEAKAQDETLQHRATGAGCKFNDVEF